MHAWFVFVVCDFSAYLFVSVCACTFILICVSVCVCVCVCAHTLTHLSLSYIITHKAAHACSCTHMHTHTYVHAQRNNKCTLTLAHMYSAICIIFFSSLFSAFIMLTAGQSWQAYSHLAVAQPTSMARTSRHPQMKCESHLECAHSTMFFLICKLIYFAIPVFICS